jgi:hypothetical protein
MQKVISKQTKYNELKDLIKNNKIDLRVIMAPPRTGSTVLENVLSLSQTIDEKVHEPFIDYGYRNGNEELGYQQILNAGALYGKNLLLKEMTHFFLKDSFEKFIDLNYRPILFNIRDPMLSIESRLKVVLKSTEMKARLSTQKTLANYLAKENGYSCWQEMNNNGKKQIIGNGDILKPDLNLQIKLLNIYAQTKGENNWNDMYNNAIINQYYVPFEDLLKYDNKRFSQSGHGWESLQEQLNTLNLKNKPNLIIDNSDYRNNPKDYTKIISKFFNIEYSDSMLEWNDVNISNNQIRKQDLIWYESLKKSYKVNPPTESPPNINAFPKFIKEYLINIAIPIYTNAYQKRLKI